MNRTLSMSRSAERSCRSICHILVGVREMLFKTVSVDLTREAVKDAPAYDPAVNLNHVAESRLHDHYGQVGYWAQSELSDRG
ncbi:MAG: hypothetical protein ABI040_00555 [Rhodoferax sp.]